MLATVQNAIKWYYPLALLELILKVQYGGLYKE